MTLIKDWRENLLYLDNKYCISSHTLIQVYRSGSIVVQPESIIIALEYHL